MSGEGLASSSSPQLLTQVRELLEFYFGNANMNRDRFLKQKMDADPHGYVDISVLCTFNKLKELTTDIKTIAEATKESTLLKLDMTRTRITRSTPVPSSIGADARSIYAELYPIESNHDTLKTIFATCGPVSYVSIPTHEGFPRGFAFIEFEKEEHAKEAVKQMNTIGNPTHSPAAPKGMRVMSKDTWHRLKDEYKELNERIARATKAQSAAPEPGVIVFFGNAGPDLGSYPIKDTRTGYARFKTPHGAQAAVKQIVSSKFELGGKQITCRVLTGTEESQYWAKIHADAAHKKLNKDTKTDEPNKYIRYNKDSKNDNNNDNNNNNSKTTNNTGGGEDTKKQKKQNKEIKFKGKKIPSISKAKPKSHVFFDDDEKAAQEDPMEGENTTSAGENTTNTTTDTTTTTTTTTTTSESEKRKRPDGANNSDKRQKLDS